MRALALLFRVPKNREVSAPCELHGHSIYDIAPTVLEAARLPLPPDFEGRLCRCSVWVAAPLSSPDRPDRPKWARFSREPE